MKKQIFNSKSPEELEELENPNPNNRGTQNRVETTMLKTMTLTEISC